MRRHPRPPGMFRPHVDPDAWAPLDRSDRETAILEVQARADQVGVILRQRDPHGFRQVAGAPAQILIAGRRATPAAHHVQSIDWRERANQHRGRRSLGLGDDVHHPVDAVVEIHVSVAGFAVHWRVAACRTWRRVAGRIAFADVRLDFDDGAAGPNALPLVNEYFAKQVARDVEGGTIVKATG